MSAHDCVIPLQAEMVGVHRCTCGTIWELPEGSSTWRRVPLARFTVVAGLMLGALVLTIAKIAAYRLDFDGVSVVALLLVAAAAAVAVAPKVARS
ncbi:hypothetical protein [Rathayibacter sp. AY1E1]|uniref:hypothetical protein n=1 Tax=Rathayibacter sp. AY1E1 TaxID=2080549 RepID=UPI000CE811DC|nr:hypothetical protein [Rathayibacter sp. AY1E1]PPH51229.1 hypothetical protein C5C67_11985 [Rathayibacter sp. AY1E1]